MENQINGQSQYWVLFTGISFVIAVCMMAGGIYNLEASFAAKGFYAMAALMLVHCSISLSKTLRDMDETRKLHNRLEDAKTEMLLRETSDSTDI